ncbi:MAG: hypothetical protein HY805_00405 [Nitrospirae bacterium]|nr:hypothetical protein [Nitrospirota bacterium]
MKKEIAFISVMMILGIAIGFGIMMVLMAVSVPSPSNLLLTPVEKGNFESMQKNLQWVTGPWTQNIFIAILILLLVITLILFILNLNPNIKNAFKQKGGILKAVAVIVISAIWIFMLFVPVGKYPEFGLERPETSMFFLFTFITGLLWLVAGEMGWAGDFSSGGVKVEERHSMPMQSFLMGAITGSSVYTLLIATNWTFKKYFIMIAETEVLDKSVEPSMLGIKMLGYGLMAMFCILFGIIAMLTVSLSPTYRTKTQRLIRLVFPVTLFLIVAVVITFLYQNADRKYDLGKKDIGEAVGIPDKASSSKTILLFKGKKPADIVIQEWPLQVSGYGVFTKGTIELSYENLKKAQDYLKAHKEGSIFNNAIREMLYKGYYALWDVNKAMEMQFSISEHLMLARMIMLNRLQAVPITTENLRYLKAYADESRWYVGGKSNLNIATAFIHFGMPEEADAWLKKAKEKGQDISEVKIETVQTKGKVSGRITLNKGNPLSIAKVAILKYQGTLDKIEDWTLISKLLDVRQLDSQGRFVFDNLGDGQYLLAIMTDKETIPYSIPSENLKVKNPPGVLKLERKTPVLNLSDIDISF